MTKAVFVLTSKSASTIFEEGGSSAWRLDRNNARQCSYAVCVRNGHSKWNQGNEPHHSAFLVGRISDVVETPTVDKTVRFLIQFSQYALVDVPQAWTGERNPVKYEDLETVGINVDALDWKPMPTASEVPPPVSKPSAMQHGSAVGALTMAQAKQGLALTFGVQPDAIEITIRG